MLASKMERSRTLRKIGLILAVLLISGGILWEFKRVQDSGGEPTIPRTTWRGYEGRWIEFEILWATPLGAIEQSECGLQGKARLFQRRRVHRTAVEEVLDPVCRYAAHWQARGPECLIEFPVGEIESYAVRNTSARLADWYYRRYQGGIFYLMDEAQHTYLIVDEKWCRWLRAERGFGVPRFGGA